MIVVDTQVVVYATTGGPFTGLAERVSFRDPDWRAPALWRSEYLNVVAGDIRRGAISVDQAVAFTNQASRLLTEATVKARDVLGLIPGSRCTAYDLEFVALAQAAGIPLVTNDRQILDSFPGIAVSLESFAGGSA